MTHVMKILGNASLIQLMQQYLNGLICQYLLNMLIMQRSLNDTKWLYPLTMRVGAYRLTNNCRYF